MELVDSDFHVHGSEDFPFPVSIVETDFKNGVFQEDQIDQFLYKNHRFTSLEILIQDLQKLSSQLNQNLLDLVNNDYNDFIRLGKSINGGDDLISTLSEDLKNFKIELNTYKQKFTCMDDDVDKALKARLLLIELKTNVKLNLLIRDQLEVFDQLVKNVHCNVEQLRKITSVYLSILNINEYLSKGVGSLQEKSHFQEQFVQAKISSIYLEFNSFIDHVAQRSKQEKDNDLRLEVAKIRVVLQSRWKEVLEAGE